MVNKVILIGNVGADPKIRRFQNGDKLANLILATSESYKDKNTGEKNTKTQWHNIVVFGGLVGVIENYVKKGSKLYVEGQIETRTWQDQSGQDRYTTEIVLRGFGSTLLLLSGKQEETQSADDQKKSNGYQPQDDLDDEIPF